MDYPPTTDTLRENVRRQMEREAKRQLDRVNEKAGSARQNAPGVTRLEGGVSEAGGVQEMSMSKWRTIRARPLLMIIAGGRK